MNTHVLVVNDRTFKYHIEYMFAGTGGREPDSEAKQITKDKILNGELNQSLEKVCVGLMADWGRVRKGDHIIFYVVQGNDKGKFFGVFKATENGVSINDNGDYLKKLNINNHKTNLEQVKEMYSDMENDFPQDNEDSLIHTASLSLEILSDLKGDNDNTMVDGQVIDDDSDFEITVFV